MEGVSPKGVDLLEFTHCCGRQIYGLETTLCSCCARSVVCHMCKTCTGCVCVVHKMMTANMKDTYKEWAEADLERKRFMHGLFNK